MKKMTTVLLLVMILVGSCVPSAMAATVLERVDALENLLGVRAPGDTIEDRLVYLESQLGLQKQADQTLEERMQALESLLGAPSATEKGSASSDEGASGKVIEVGLSKVEVFSQDGLYVCGNAHDQSICIDNYGDAHANVLYAQDIMREKSVEFYLDGAYSKLKGLLYVTKSARDFKDIPEEHWKGITFSIYGDDVLLYQKKGGFDSKARSEAVEVDISGVTFLKICTSGSYFARGMSGAHICSLGDVVLTKEG